MSVQVGAASLQEISAHPKLAGRYVGYALVPITELMAGSVIVHELKIRTWADAEDEVEAIPLLETCASRIADRTARLLRTASDDDSAEAPAREEETIYE